MEVRDLLSQVMLDMSGQVSGNLTPKRPNPMVILTPLPHKLRDLSGPVDTSSQVGALDNAEMAEASLEEIPTATSPTAKTQGPSDGTPPADASHLQEKANKALGELLATKSSINTHQWKLAWELGIELCQNDSETAESIKEAKATCTCSIQEAKALCFTAIRDTEAQEASQADSCQQRHAKSIQHLEEQAIQEEG